jgi:catechol 2,3-dioxygenase-like lactoylglutathione lyase family enzyme
MTATPWFKVGLRVEDVEAAASLYAGLGFERVGAVPNERGDPVLVILRRGEVNLHRRRARRAPVPRHCAGAEHQARSARIGRGHRARGR